MTQSPSPGAVAHIDALRQAARAGRGPICFDSAPLIDVIAAVEPHTSLLDPILRSPDVPIVISVVSLAEAVTRPATAGDTARVAAIHQALRSLPNLTIVDFDQRHAIEAATVRGRTGLRLPDAAVIATARLAGASALIGNDRKWLTRPLGVPYHHVNDVLALP